MSRFDQRLSVGRRVVCAAMRSGDSLVVGPRHYDEVMRTAIKNLPQVAVRHWEQGFIDQFGVFMTREEAWKVAVENGQVIRRAGPLPEECSLFSEDLY